MNTPPFCSHERWMGLYIRDQFAYDGIRLDFQQESWQATTNDAALVAMIGA